MWDRGERILGEGDGAPGADTPAAIRNLARTIQEAPFPMFMLVGAERRLFYNAAYTPILGPHHPRAAGRPFFEIWPEARAQIEPVVDRAFAGEPSRFEDLPIVLFRPDPAEAFFTFSYSPVRDDQDRVVAVLCVCSETTEACLARRRQGFLLDLETSLREVEDPREIIDRAQAALGRHFAVSRVGYGSVDASERYFTTSGNWVDGSVPHQAGTHDLAAFGEEIHADLRRGVALAIEDTHSDPRAQSPEAVAAFEALQARAVATVSLVKQGRFVAALYLHHHTPRRWRSDEFDLIGEVADRTWSAVERAHAQSALRRLNERQAFLLDLNDQLRPLADAEQIKAVAAEMLGRHLNVSRAGYGEIDPEQTHVTVERDWTDGTIFSLAGETRPLEVFGPAIIDELKAGRLLMLDAVADNPLSAPYAEGYASIGTQALLVAPLIKGERLSAILYLHEPRPRAWTELDAKVTLDVAERTWAAVERARAEAAAAELHRTLERRVEAALDQQARFANILQSTDAPIQMIDRDYRFTAINPACQRDYERVFGVRPDIGDSLLAILGAGPHADAAKAVWSRALSGESFDQLGWWGDGSRDRRAYEMRFRPLHDATGAVTGAYLIGRDVTDLLHEQERLASAEAQLRQAQKMEAMGRLTGGVAHDFNNLLTPIVGALDLLQRKGIGGEREQRLISAAAQSADRAKVLVQRLLAFARRQPLQARPVDLDDLVHGMADLISSTAGPQIRVAVELGRALPAVLADPNQLEMALLNLAVNARDAMPSGGTLRISADSASGAAPAELAPGDFVRLSVADTGVGMDEETLKHAVEPFFSTKGIGKGTGLGLSMVHGLAAQLGGALAIRSHPGLGTNVELWLPAATGRPEEPLVSTAMGISAQPAGLALVVDDEDAVRTSLAEMLVDLGYQVVEAASAEAALQKVREGLRLELLVTDHLMAGMNGTELAREVLALRPNTRVLVVSGYAEVQDIAPDLPRLAKPFRRDELSAALAG